MVVGVETGGVDVSVAVKVGEDACGTGTSGVEYLRLQAVKAIENPNTQAKTSHRSIFMCPPRHTLQIRQKRYISSAKTMDFVGETACLNVAGQGHLENHGSLGDRRPIHPTTGRPAFRCSDLRHASGFVSDCISVKCWPSPNVHLRLFTGRGAGFAVDYRHGRRDNTRQIRHVRGQNHCVVHLRQVAELLDVVLRHA